MAMDCKDGESPGPRQKDKTLPGHDIFCTPENSNFLSATPYETLDPTQREIRLLKVLPESGSGFVECELLPSAPIAELRGKYLALSYCAGDPRDTKTILVNGVKCNVFSNLCHALTCARHFWTTQPGNGDFLLWTDQICINQADLSERSHQVGFMKDIYESAQKTLICLSTSDTHGRGMEWLTEIYHIERSRSQARALKKFFLTLRPPWRTQGMSTEDSKKRMAVIWEEIIESPWWSRAWVFQEFMVSADATFLSGYYQISWTEAWLALKRFINLDSRPELTFSPNSIFQRRKHMLDDGYDDNDYISRMAEETAGKVWFMLKTKAEWKDTAASLTFLLARSRNSQASDGRDRIYAFLGLADPGYTITPDYSASNTLCQVLTETTKNIILFENSLHVLSILDAPPLARRPGLPSWAVDWTREGITRPLDREYLDTIENTPREKGQAIASFRKTAHPKTQQETTAMEVAGVFVKFVAPAEVEFSYLGAEKNDVLEVWNLCGSPCDFFLRRESYGHQMIQWINPYGRTTRLRSYLYLKGLDLDSDSDSDSAWTPATKSARTEAEELRVITIF